jgi:hypothetical protein
MKIYIFLFLVLFPILTLHSPNSDILFAFIPIVGLPKPVKIYKNLSNITTVNAIFFEYQ